MAPVAGPRFRNLTGIFAGDTAATWLDYVGHLTERSNAKVAHAMVGPIADALKEEPPPRRR